MQRGILLGIVLAMIMMLASCGGSNFVGTKDSGFNFGDLDFSLSVDPGSTVAANEVEGELLNVTYALNARSASALPAGYVGHQGMHFTPLSSPGSGFSGKLTVRVTMGSPAAGEFDDVLLYLFYIDPDTHVATMMNTGRGDANNRVSFNINALGFFVVAENSAIARPGGFTISAFADLASAPVGTEINFWAVPINGTAPYTLAWSFGDGSQANGEEVSHAYTAAGTYNVTLTATDALGSLAPAVSTPIEITAGSAGPLEIDAITVTPDTINHLHFNYAVTLGGGTGPFTYEWSFDLSATATETGNAAQDHTFAAEGLYMGQVEVSDSTGASVTGGFVSDARSLLIEATPTEGTAPLEVDFTVTALGFAASDVITLDYGDGSTGTVDSTAIQHTYTAAGVYQAQASSVRTTGDESYPFDSNTVLIQPIEGDYSPFIQLTQPLVPDPDEPFDVVGVDFGDAASNREVTVAGFTIDVISWSDNIIQVQMPDGIRPNSGGLVIERDSEQASNRIVVTFEEQVIPTAIQNVLPPVAQAGNRVLITGHGLPSDITVTVDEQTALLERTDENGILAVLPGGLVDGAYNLIVDASLASYTFPIAILSDATGDIPQLDSVTPQIQEIGQGDVHLGGLRLGTMNTAVAFAQGYALPRSTHNSTLITLTSPVPSIDSWVCVVNRNYVSNAMDLVFVHRPEITSLSAAEAAIGETVDINGINFGTRVDNDQVLLGQLALTILNWTDTLIQVQIPQGAENGQIVVVKQLTSNAVDFRVLPQSPGTPGGGQL